MAFEKLCLMKNANKISQKRRLVKKDTSKAYETDSARIKSLNRDEKVMDDAS